MEGPVKYLFFLIVMLIAINCSVKKHYKTLSFFFDGVPAPVADSIASIDSVNIGTLTDSATMSAVKPEVFHHVPYQQHRCEICHDQTFMGQLIEPQPGLCYICHENLEDNYKTLHGPVAAGYCSECHSPHQSKNEKLLTETGEKLCFYCHDADLVKSADMHNISEETQCIVCHDPHGGENRFIVREEACFNCHENFKKQYIVLHGPVNTNSCYTCHLQHGTNNSNLIRSGQDICLYCHDISYIFKTETHESIENTVCTDCHNPHGGEDRTFLF